jgi:hypothetical protein
MYALYSFSYTEYHCAGLNGLIRHLISRLTRSSLPNSVRIGYSCPVLLLLILGRLNDIDVRKGQLSAN